MGTGEVSAAAETEREIAWTDLHVGDRLGPLHYELSPATAASFEAASTMSREARRILHEHGRFAHPLNTVSDYSSLMRDRYGARLGTGLHTRHASVVYEPLPLDVPIETTAEIEELYQRRGRDYWVMVYRSSAQGRLLVTHTMTATVDRPDQEQPTAAAGAAANTTTSPTVERPVWTDSELWSLPPRMLTREGFIDFGRQYRLRFGDDGPPAAGAHTSVEVARAVGLPDVVGYSSHYYCWFAELALLRFGADWMRGGSLDARFLAPVFPGDAVRVNASADDDGNDVVAVRATNQDERLIAVGHIIGPGVSR